MPIETSRKASSRRNLRAMSFNFPRNRNFKKQTGVAPVLSYPARQYFYGVLVLAKSFAYGVFSGKSPFTWEYTNGGDDEEQYFEEDEQWIGDIEAVANPSSDFNPVLLTMNPIEALVQCKMARSDGFLYTRTIDAYISSIGALVSVVFLSIICVFDGADLPLVQIRYLHTK